MFELGATSVFPGQLTRSSLGQLANIGDLYDARTDRFTGQSIVTDSTGSPAVNSTPMESSRKEFLVDATSYDRLALLVNDKDLQLSVVLSLTVPERNIETLIGQDDINISPTNGFLLRTVTALREQVDSITDVKRLVSSSDITTNGSATHVVVGIVWGATVAVFLDHNDTGLTEQQSVSDNLQEHLQMLTSTLKSGSPPDSQVMSHIKSRYTVTCVSSGLTENNLPYRTSLENAVALLSNLPRLSRSGNYGKGSPQSFILMPLSLLTESSAPSRVEESVVNQALSLFREVTVRELGLVGFSQSIAGRKNYLQGHEVCRIDKFLAEFQLAKKTLFDDVTSAVVAVRSGRPDQSRLSDILHEFSHSRYSADNLRAFSDSVKPTLEKIQFLDQLIHEGIVIIGDSLTDLRDITRNPDVYILYATDRAKEQHPLLWKENSSAFLDVVGQEKRKCRERTSGNSSPATFAYIDCDIVRGAHIDEGIAIYRYKRSLVVSRNVADELVARASLNIAASLQRKQRYTARPVKRALVELPCPGASRRCGNSQRIWSCDVCKEEMEYGFGDNFYCSCGRAPVNTFGYKCNGSYHGDDFLSFQPRVVKEHVRNMTPIRELNILHLGETGVGKSTWINGFANYILYSTLSEAENNDDVSKFTMMSERFEEVVVQTGTDRNEVEVGQYVFRLGINRVRIINTPGIGDTSGIDQDRINFQNIMTYLSSLDEINGICILLKPNNARLTVMFKFCIDELLTHLHRDACKNIVFCFTNARGTFYKPGDTLPPLRELIAKSNIDLHLTENTVYCIDNESVRFLAALKQGIKFDGDEKKNYSTSWEMSVKETERLIEYISSLPSHKVKNTLSLNDARRLIVALSRLLAEITSTIQNNIGVIEQRRQEVMESTKHKEDLNTKLYIPVIDLQTTHLDPPRTVCTASSCVKHISVGDVQKTDYVTHCHPHCYCLPSGVQTNVVNCVAVQKCQAMNESHNCRHCGCSWSVHMHITYDCTQVARQVVDQNVERQIREKATDIEKTKRHLQTIEDLIKALEDEKRQVANVSAKFACFLKHNAIATVSDVIADYLEHLIDAEKGRISAGADRSALKGLESMKTMYEEEVKILEKAINNSESGESVPTVEKIQKLYDNFCQLPITGPMLKGAMTTVETAGVGAMQKKEKEFTTPPFTGSTSKSIQSRVVAWGFIDNEPVLGRLVRVFKRSSLAINH